MASKEGLDVYVPFLRELSNHGLQYCLEGGQAVNFWAEFFSIGIANPELARFLPFTSKDCDIYVDPKAWEHIRTRGKGVLRKSDDPASGQLGVLEDPEVPQWRVDLMGHVYGIPEHLVKKMRKRVYEFDGVRVMDPLFLFKSKCHCWIDLQGKDPGRQDEKHLQMLIVIVRLHLSLAVEKVVAGNAEARDLIREVKVLLNFRGDEVIRRAGKLIGVELISMVPLEDFLNSGVVQLTKFANSLMGKYP